MEHKMSYNIWSNGDLYNFAGTLENGDRANESSKIRDVCKKDSDLDV